jgi:hypothetical protein
MSSVDEQRHVFRPPRKAFRAEVVGDCPAGLWWIAFDV